MFEQLHRYLGTLAAAGVTTVSDHGYDPNTAPLYQAVLGRPDAPVRVRAYEIGRPGSAISQPPNSGDDRFRLIGVKYWADGSPWQGNIAVSVPYLNTAVTCGKMGLPENYHGSMNYTKD